MTLRFIIVTATLPSRRRSGFQFGKEAVVLDVDEIGEDVVGYLRQDPCLKIREISEQDAAYMMVGFDPPDETASAQVDASLDLPEHGFQMRYQGQSTQIALTGDPVADCTTFFDEVALFAEKTGLAEAAQRSQPADEVAADPAADVANNQEKASALAGGGVSSQDAGRDAARESAGTKSDPATAGTAKTTAKAKGGDGAKA